MPGAVLLGRLSERVKSGAFRVGEVVERGRIRRGPRERNRLETLARIRAASTELFAVKDFDDVTMRDIAEAAGIGPATLFRHVDQKIDLLTLAYSEQMDDVLDAIEDTDARREIESPSTAGRDFCQRILRIYSARCEFYLRNPKNGALYLAQGFDERSPSSVRNIAQGDRTIRQVASILDDGQRLGVIIDGVSVAHVAQNCHGIYIHEIQRTAIRGFTPESIWDRVRDRLTVQLKPLIVDERADSWGR